MSLRIMLSVFVTLIGGMAASAADLPVQSEIGAIFAEPAPGPPVLYRAREYSDPIFPYNGLPPAVWARGGYYYGSPWSFYYGGPYYGGPYHFYGARLPYVCGLYGYC